MSKRLLVRDQQGERERLLVGTMTVGRDTRCDISDADPLLSRRHAEFVCRPDSLVVRDLNSRNGISVNGVKVPEAVLRPGDVIKVARLVMTYLGDVGRAAEDDKVRSKPPAIENVPSPPGGASNPTGLPPEEDRTRVVARQGGSRTASPDQVAVARTAPSLPAQLRPSALDASASTSDDTDRTRPIVRPEDVKTDIPVSPRFAFPAAMPAPAVPVTAPPPPAAAPPRVAAPPPTAAPPPAQVPLNELSLEFRPLPIEDPPPRATADPKTGGDRFLIAAAGLVVLVFTLTAIPMMIWVAYRRDVPAVPWNFLVVLGPSLLGSLAAGFLTARWLRRTAARR
jgi:predicted component of type VI protein secretion system